MVKNEDDIIKDWIEYHGNIFGFNNLYIVDNCSTDNTYEICKEYISKGIFLTREFDYKKKGLLTTEYSKNLKCDFFIPLDIDEFICFYDKKNNRINNNDIIKYLESIVNVDYGVYKMKYLIPFKTNNSNGLTKFTHAVIQDNKENGKTFINCKKVGSAFSFDHGNYVPSNTYISSNLFLIHYHCRSHEQFFKKIISNVTGLGYPLDIGSLKALVEKNVCGVHHVYKMIEILENTDYNFDPKIAEKIKDDWIYIGNIY